MEIGRDTRRPRTSLLPNFCSGFLVGLLIVMSLGSFVISWKSQTDSFEHELDPPTVTPLKKIEEPTQPARRIRMKVFVGVQVGDLSSCL